MYTLVRYIIITLVFIYYIDVGWKGLGNANYNLVVDIETKYIVLQHLKEEHYSSTKRFTIIYCLSIN